MPPRQKEFDAVCLIIDVGATSFASGFLDRAIKCTSEMIQRKVYSESEDKYAMVLVGCRRSRNDLDYPNIMVVDNTEGRLAKANFGMLKFVEKELKNCAGPDVTNGDWLDAVVVGMDLIHNSTEGSKVRSKRIIVLTDMGCEASDDKLEMVMDAIKRDQVEFTFLLPDWDDLHGSDSTNDGNEENGISHHDNSRGEPQKRNGDKNDMPSSRGETKPRTAIQDAGVIIMESISRVSPEAERCGIKVAQELLFNKERKKKKSMAWKVDLEIGPDIRIPTAGFVAVRRENPKSWKRCLAKESSSSDAGFDELKPETTFVRNNEDQEVVEPENLIDAFKYGSKVCPMSEVEKSAGKYESGPKSLILIGFVKRAEVPVSLLLGDGCMMFQPVMESDYSKMALSSLVEAMVREEMVAIVRRVYCKNSAPKLAALIPEDSTDTEQEGNRSLVYIELPFSEDLRTYQFPPLWSSANDISTQSAKNDPTSDQLKAVDNLIDNMMLESEDQNEEEGCLKTDSLLNPYYQHLYQCLTSRALNPAKGRLLPKVDERIKEIMEAPESINTAASKSLSEIKKLFKLETVEVKKEKKTGDKMFKSIETKDSESSQLDDNGVVTKRLKLSQDSIDLSLNDSSGNNVTEVGTTTPVQDFERLLQLGFHINTVAIQMEKVILNLIKASFANQMNEKVIACLQCYRQACVEMKSPTVYNKFIRELKDDFLLNTNKRETMWADIVRNNIGLIDKTDCSISSISPEESKAFLAEKEVETSEASEIFPSDDEDLLDDL